MAQRAPEHEPDHAQHRRQRPARLPVGLRVPGGGGEPVHLGRPAVAVQHDRGEHEHDPEQPAGRGPERELRGDGRLQPLPDAPRHRPDHG